MTVKDAVIAAEKSPLTETAEQVYIEAVMALDKIRISMFDNFEKLLQNPNLAWTATTAGILATFHRTLDELEYVNTLSPKIFKTLIQNINRLRSRLENFRNDLATPKYKPVDYFNLFIGKILATFKEDVVKTGDWPRFTRTINDEINAFGQHAATFSR